MASQAVHRYTLTEYLDIEDTLDYRSEFHDGTIYPAELATTTHALLEERIGLALASVLSPCSIFGSSLNLYIESANKILHPDKTLICGDIETPKPDCVVNPTLIVEVTSPKTIDYDYGQKRALYFRLSSLKYYLLVSQTEGMIGMYSRREDGWLYVDFWDGDSLKLPLLGASVEIPVATVYRNILGD